VEWLPLVRAATAASFNAMDHYLVKKLIAIKAAILQGIH